jgi:hypothetical protein
MDFGGWLRSLGLGQYERGEHLREAEVRARSLGDQRRLGKIAHLMVSQCLYGAGNYDDALRFHYRAHPRRSRDRGCRSGLSGPGLRSGDGGASVLRTRPSAPPSRGIAQRACCEVSLIAADVSDGARIEGATGLPTNPAGRAVEEYLSPFSMTPLSVRPPR